MWMAAPSKKQSKGGKDVWQHKFGQEYRNKEIKQKYTQKFRLTEFQLKFNFKQNSLKRNPEKQRKDMKDINKWDTASKES